VFIGVLMLFGIVAKNSILLIDFAIEEMATGKTKLEAITEAGHKRAQPIIMTTVAMIAGMVPTAISVGGDAGWRAPMGTVVIGGLTLSTLLTLLIVPAGFSLADGLKSASAPGWRGWSCPPNRRTRASARPAPPCPLHRLCAGTTRSMRHSRRRTTAPRRLARPQGPCSSL
jgi:predicted RND superfamily exporter protein